MSEYLKSDCVKPLGCPGVSGGAVCRPLDPLVMRFLEVTHETLSKHVDR